MKKARLLAPWKDGTSRPAIYHCVSRVVGRRQALGEDDKGQLWGLMRMQERFTGCRVLAYCFLSDHLHFLVEVPLPPPGGLADKELLQRLGATHDGPAVAEVARELREARRKVSDGRAADAGEVAAIHERYTYRMNDLGQFMKVLLQRFTRWFNVRHQRSGTLWESRYKSTLVEQGVATRMLAAYIDLNPVRAGLVKDPADYRWSSYGEAMGNGAHGGGRQARAGLARAILERRDGESDASHWTAKVAKEYQSLLLAGNAVKTGEATTGGKPAKSNKPAAHDRPPAAKPADNPHRDAALGAMLRGQVRYFTDGGVVGSRGFVDEVFHLNRSNFGAKRKSGARKFRGQGAPAAGTLWCARDLRKGNC